MDQSIKIEKIDNYRWRIPKVGGMRVDGLVYATEELLKEIRLDQSIQQVANVAHLPGILKHSFAMPDIHWGYGFPIGGVAAMDAEQGVVSPGGVGYDINCGVRLLASNLDREEVAGKERAIVASLFGKIPTGVGSRGPLRLSIGEEKKVLTQGVRWALSNGYALEEDIAHIEEGGCFSGADPDAVSPRALERGKSQLGTLGSGNHFVEAGFVEEVYDAAAADALGLFRGQVTIIVHTGSRGFGYQVCDDSIKTMLAASRRYGIDLPDRQLCCAPIGSSEGKRYLAAMACAVNYAFTNRQVITHWVREALGEALRLGPKEAGLRLVYDVTHNIAKFEEHVVDGKKKRVCIHRKGATRAFPPGHPTVPEDYREVGQPVLIPGDMGRYSFVLVGTEQAFQETFGSTCHGAGRMLSRTKAKERARGRAIEREMEKEGIYVRSATRKGLAEEISEAYKDVASVVDAVQGAGISRKVAKLRPFAVIKG